MVISHLFVDIFQIFLHHCVKIMYLFQVVTSFMPLCGRMASLCGCFASYCCCFSSLLDNFLSRWCFESLCSHFLRGPDCTGSFQWSVYDTKKLAAYHILILVGGGQPPWQLLLCVEWPCAQNYFTLCVMYLSSGGSCTNIHLWVCVSVCIDVFFMYME